MRRLTLSSLALIAFSVAPAAAQQADQPPAAHRTRPGSAALHARSREATAPLLRQLVTLDLRDAPFADALREISYQLGGRLMYDEAAASVERRVTLRRKDVRAGEALEWILEGTGLEVVASGGGSVVLVKPAARPVVQDSAIVRGRVFDAATRAPVPHAVVTLQGRGRQVMADETGFFVLSGIPAGERVLSFERLGYRPATITLTLAPGQDTTIVVTMASEPIALRGVVTTISGERRRAEVGNSIAMIDAAREVENNTFRDLSDLLAGRANGLMSIPGGGSPNAPTRHRIRGINSITGSNNPIVIIDGVRALTSYERCLDGNLVGCDQLPSRYDDIDLDDIESVEILKGPSAAAMWGSDASNGVIVIKTKRGQAGPTRWTVHYEEGFTTAPTSFLVPMQGLGRPPNGTAIVPCRLTDQALGLCVPVDSVAGGFNRYAHPRTTSMATGRTTDFDLSVSGGSDAVQFYFSGGYRSDLGTSKMPDIDQKIVREALGRPLPGWMVRPDAKNTASFTGRVTGRFSESLDYSIATSFAQIDSRMGGDGVMGATNDLRSVADTFELSEGWDQFFVQRKHHATRFTGSISLNWHPVQWFSARATVGRDYAFVDKGEIRRRGWCLPFCSPTSRDALGQVAYSEGRDLLQSVDLGGSLQIPILDRRVVFRTAFGAQHTRFKTRNMTGTSYDLAVGRVDFNSTPAANRSVLQSSDDRATFGTYLEQSVSLNDRLFVGAALRRDIGSALGREVAPLYPKWHASWLASEEPMFAGLRDRGINLRLRAAFGHAGVQPATTAKLRSFGQLPRFVEADGTFGANYAYISGVGNAELRPERSREIEGGFELGLWDDRLMLDFTYFHKYTRDAIVSRELAPSLGLQVTSRQSYNVGNVRNTGMEALVIARLIEQPWLQASVEIGYASRENELVSLGTGVEPFSITASNINLATVMDNDGVVMPGYPLFGRWARPILGYSDANGDGIITPNEVKLGDTLVFMGASQPKADMSIRPVLGLWNGLVRVSAAFDYVHDLMQLNFYSANMWFTSRAVYDPTAPLRVQACYTAGGPPINNDFCFYESVNVLRLRNLSVGISVPERLVGMVGARSGSFHILGSNLGVWSNYSGIDPLVNTESAAGNRLVADAVVPRGQTWAFRLRLTY
jgi:TonB-dependent SusC/RagA subfamily outer membrane receptor